MKPSADSPPWPARPDGDASPAAAARRARRRPGSGPAAGARAAATVQQWMQRTPSLLDLQQQALGSRRMGQQLRQALPRELAEAVLPGRYADGAWSLNASSSAVAAKLKLYVPLLLRRLQKDGWPLTRIQVRVLMPQTAPGAAGSASPARATPAPAEVRERLRAMRKARE